MAEVPGATPITSLRGGQSASTAAEPREDAASTAGRLPQPRTMSLSLLPGELLRRLFTLGGATLVGVALMGTCHTACDALRDGRIWFEAMWADLGGRALPGTPIRFTWLRCELHDFCVAVDYARLYAELHARRQVAAVVDTASTTPTPFISQEKRRALLTLAVRLRERPRGADGAPTTTAAAAAAAAAGVAADVRTNLAELLGTARLRAAEEEVCRAEQRRQQRSARTERAARRGSTAAAIILED